MSGYILMAMTNAATGQEEAYNSWFNDVHIPEVLGVPGVESAQRYELTPEQRTPAPHPYRFAAVYELETENLSETLAAIGEVVRSGTKTTASDPSQRALWVYRPIGGKRTADQAG